MTKREMMGRHYDERQMHLSELSLKHGIEDGSIRLVGDEISGNTYESRLVIKAYFGGRWDSVKKVWRITRDLGFAKKIFSEGLIV